MGEEMIGTLFMVRADGEYNKIGEIGGVGVITNVELDDGPGEDVWTNFNFRVKRKGYKKRLNSLCKSIFGMTKVEVIFRKKKKRSRKRIRKHSQDLQLL